MPLASTEVLIRATVSSTEWLLARRRTPVASVAAVGVGAADVALAEAAPASSTVMQNNLRIGLGSLRIIIGAVLLLSCHRIMPFAAPQVKSERLIASMPNMHDVPDPQRLL